jgi:hypothetical protein
MSVIGRLDDQVNAIIISPLAQRNADEAEVHRIPSPENAANSDRPEASAATPESTTHKTKDAVPFPVWLL